MKLLHICLLFAVSIGFTSWTVAQTYTLAVDSAAQITVTGTSTLHGWTVAVKEVQDIPSELILSGENENTIDSFAFSVVVSSMDGGRGASMNAKITKALQAVAHPIIQYQQNEQAVMGELDDSGNFKLLSKGILKMVGLEKAVEIEVSGQKTETGIILSLIHI